MSATNNQMTERDTIEDLLPWHAAGTLNRKDAERVEHALAADPELARRFALVSDELAETILLNESLGAPSKRAMEKLFTAIDAEPARKKGVSFDPGGRIAEFFAGFSPRQLAYGGVAAAFLVVVQAGVLGTVLVNENSPSYEVQSAHEDDNTRGVDLNSYALVRFNPQATVAEITKFLSDHKASIVDGPRPTSSGMYKVRVGMSLSKEDVAKLVKEMQSDRVVGFASPTE